MSIGLCVVYCLVEGVITDLVHISPTSGTSGAAAHATATFSELMAHWAAKEAASGGWHHVIPDNSTGDLSSSTTNHKGVVILDSLPIIS